MITILLEVKSNDVNRMTDNFYNPAPKEFKKYPRTDKGMVKAFSDLKKVALENEWVEDYRFVVYEGKFQYYNKDVEPMGVFSKDGLKVELN